MQVREIWGASGKELLDYAWDSTLDHASDLTSSLLALASGVPDCGSSDFLVRLLLLCPCNFILLGAWLGTHGHVKAGHGPLYWD